MVLFKEESLEGNPRIGTFSSVTWLYLSIEFLVGLAVSSFLPILRIVKALLPPPPRDLRGDIVLVTGASSSLGSSLAEEFAKGGCSVICADRDLHSVEAIASRIGEKYPPIKSIGSEHHKRESPLRLSTFAYECDLFDRKDIQSFAQKVKDEVGIIDVLVTCTGNPSDDIFDTVSKTLMSHYWTMVAFLPSMLLREKGHIIGVLPTLSSEDAYLGTKAAVAGLIDNLGQNFGHRNTELKFISILPAAESRGAQNTEEQVAKDVVQAVRMGQSTLSLNWSSKMMYSISSKVYNWLNSITQYMDT